MTEPDALWLNGRDLSPAEVADLARGRIPAGNARLHPTARQRCAETVVLKNRLIKAGEPIYGVTTGFGDSAGRQIAPERTALLQRNLVRYHLNGTGPKLTPDTVRATMLIRANCLARSVSGARPDVIERLLDLLAADVLPVIPERGTVGASGDLVPLCYLASVLQGEGEVVHRGVPSTAEDVHTRLGLAPLTLEAKEGLALINGTSVMSAFAVLALADAIELAYAADLATTMAVEALLGNRGHYVPFLHEHKPHRGQLRSAERIAAGLVDSRLALDHEEILAANAPLAERGFQRLDRRVQDSYSVRCAPHVIGVLHDTLDWVEPWLRVEINSANDNPLFDVDTDRVRSGGNFYGGHVGQAMDSLKVAVASVADLLDRQLELVVDEKFNNGLTPNLIPLVDPGAEDAGLHHGYKGMQIACSALTAEALKNAAPATVFSRSTEAHNQDKVSMGTIAARDARSVVELTTEVAAIHLHALCQALDLRGVELAGTVSRRVHAAVRAVVPPVLADRRMDHDIAAIVDLIRTGTLREAATG